MVSIEVYKPLFFVPGLVPDVYDCVDLPGEQVVEGRKETGFQRPDFRENIAGDIRRRMLHDSARVRSR